MSSGNFLIGKNLSLEGFNQYIKPALEKQNVKITDYFSFENQGKRVLISIFGDGSLERVIGIGFDDALANLVEDVKRTNNDQDKLMWEHQIKSFNRGEYRHVFETIGVYQDNETASKIFQNLAVKYSVIDLESRLEKLKEFLKDFGEKFKKF